MFDIYIDFDAIRERAYDYVQFAAGTVQDFIDDIADVAEEAVEKLNAYGSGEKVPFDIETFRF